MSERLKWKKESYILVASLVSIPLTWIFIISLGYGASTLAAFYALCFAINIVIRKSFGRRIGWNHLLVEDFAAALILGPGVIVIYLASMFFESEYYNLSIHRGFFIPTRKRKIEYMTKLLDGRIKPFEVAE